MMDEDLDRIQKSILYAVKILNDLVDKGILTGKAFEVQEPLASEVLEGFEPTKEELFEAMNILAADGAFGPPGGKKGGISGLH